MMKSSEEDILSFTPGTFFKSSQQSRHWLKPGVDLSGRLGCLVCLQGADDSWVSSAPEHFHLLLQVKLVSPSRPLHNNPHPKINTLHLQVNLIFSKRLKNMHRKPVGFSLSVLVCVRCCCLWANLRLSMQLIYSHITDEGQLNSLKRDVSVSLL